MQLPVLSGAFNVDVRPPQEFVHANGISRITGIAFGTRAELISVIEELCDDEGLTIFVGHGVKELQLE